MAESTSPPYALTGIVTGEVRTGAIGEIRVRIRGGSETFYAYPAKEDEKIPIGSTVLVVAYAPPRTVHVVPWVEDVTTSTNL